MVFGQCRLVNEDGLPLPTHVPTVQSCFFDELLRDNYIWTPAMVAFRRAVFIRWACSTNRSARPPITTSISVLAGSFPLRPTVP